MIERGGREGVEEGEYGESVNEREKERWRIRR